MTKDNKELFQLTKEMLDYHNEQLQKVDAEVNQTVARAIIISITLLLASAVIGVHFMYFVKKIDCSAIASCNWSG
ncbi:hypothetical protein OL548_28655 [Lysinibacillus sp. MHQ-1]|nr:hypothetical protein OL548_28655 [Lysinibacillus sp. MHQ-1]